ncbi:hypothetical protein AB0M42_17255 [Streptomyces sp. NPDC051784]|uniref:hypothetical protein n=1 Tax=Streptomyces sp. NPDC051784 TaxID=3155805 RepID=UPI0034275418
MLRHNAWRGVLVGATMAALTVVGSGAANAAGAQATAACHVDGYVCMTVNDVYEPTVYVAEGDSYTFLRASEVTTISNDTSVMYCFSGDFNFSVDAGETLEVPRTVTELVPTAGRCLS